jgi:hypothetical protein
MQSFTILSFVDVTIRSENESFMRCEGTFISIKLHRYTLRACNSRGIGLKADHNPTSYSQRRQPKVASSS